MNIGQINNIFSTRGPEAALASARAAMMDDWVIKAMEEGRWEPGKKSDTKPAPRYAEISAVNRPTPRIGKTAKSGGLSASVQRKKAKAEASRELRAKMQSANGKNK